jgi:hypothetical protein
MLQQEILLNAVLHLTHIMDVIGVAGKESRAEGLFIQAQIIP